jgi:ubiquinone/menaquinone biosynthesis C-methylase UbiE
MLEYLENDFDLDDARLVSALDELSLWSAPFGLMMLEHIPMRPGMKVLDIGFGAGFPLLELAQRLGSSSTVYGIDPWKAAIERARLKKDLLRIENVKIVEGDAAAMSFEDNMFDLIVSNIGINNFEHPSTVLGECFRVAAPGGVIALTSNPVGHMEEFYAVYEETLKELALPQYLEKLEAQKGHRLSIGTICQLLQQAGFSLNATHRQVFRMRYADGSAFFNHSFIRMGFMDGWKKVIPEDQHQRIFQTLEKKLNQIAQSKGELGLTIPTVYIEAEKSTESFDG